MQTNLLGNGSGEDGKGGDTKMLLLPQETAIKAGIRKHVDTSPRPLRNMTSQ